MQAWKSEKLRSSKKAETADIVVAGLGVAGMLVGIYGSYAQGETESELESARLQADTFENVPGLEPDEQKIADLEDKRQRQETMTIVGYGVGVPVLLTGAVLFLVGRSRQSKLRGMTVSADGIRLRF